jgi:hypothetical protein
VGYAISIVQQGDEIDAPFSFLMEYQMNIDEIRRNLMSSKSF